MSERFIVTPEHLSLLKTPVLENPPSWLHELIAPLTYEPIQYRSSTGLFVYIGNSGLFFVQADGEEQFEMHFSPNGDASSDRTNDGDELRNVGIWAAAMVQFLQYIQAHRNVDSFPHLNFIIGYPNAKIMPVIVRLLESLDVQAVTMTNSEYGPMLTIDIGRCMSAMNSDTFPTSPLGKISQKYMRLQGQVELINPRLWRDLPDKEFGLYYYELFEAVIGG